MELLEQQQKQCEKDQAYQLTMVPLTSPPATPPYEESEAVIWCKLPVPASFNPEEEQLDQYLLSYERHCELARTPPKIESNWHYSFLPANLRAALGSLPTKDQHDYAKALAAPLHTATYTSEACHCYYKEAKLTKQDNMKTILHNKLGCPMTGLKLLK